MSSSISSTIISRIHLTIGMLGLILFLLTGQYMDHWLNHLQGMEHGMRMMYRTAHIYLLWASLLNLLAANQKPGALGKLVTLWWLSSAAIAFSPFLILFSFFFESGASDLTRPLTRQGIFFAVFGVLVQVILSHRQKGGVATQRNPRSL